jgi:hypothetical protein
MGAQGGRGAPCVLLFPMLLADGAEPDVARLGRVSGRVPHPSEEHHVHVHADIHTVRFQRRKGASASATRRLSRPQAMASAGSTGETLARLRTAAVSPGETPSKPSAKAGSELRVSRPRRRAPGRLLGVTPAARKAGCEPTLATTLSHARPRERSPGAGEAGGGGGGGR